MSRKRKALVLALATAASIASMTAIASAGFENQYRGSAEKDSDTYVGFDLKKTGGKTKVNHLNTLLKYHCEGDSSRPFVFESPKGFRVNDKKRFSGTVTSPLQLTRRGSASTLTLKIAGKLKSGGKASGTISGTVTNPPVRGGAPSRCATGGLDWKASKGGGA